MYKSICSNKNLTEKKREISGVFKTDVSVVTEDSKQLIEQLELLDFIDGKHITYIELSNNPRFSLCKFFLHY